MSRAFEALAGQTVAVTGANGFLGGHLIEALSAAGAQPRALVRNARPGLFAPAVQVRAVAYDQPESLDAALGGVDALVHAAGGGKVGDVEGFYRANRDTTVQLLEASQRVVPNLGRFVLISSAAAHGPATLGRASLESDPPQPGSHYGKSKRAAEEAALSVKDRLPVSILRPPAVYGPADTRMLGLFAAVQRRLLPKIGKGETSMVYVEDCVQAILRAICTPHLSGRIYFVCDGQAYSHQRIGEAIEAALGTQALRIPVPAWLLKTVGAASERFAQATGRTTFLTSDKVADLLQPSWVLNPGLIQDELGFEAQTLFEQGALHTARWYRDQGWI